MQKNIHGASFCSCLVIATGFPLFLLPSDGNFFVAPEAVLCVPDDFGLFDAAFV
jgi:hypothetical protein